MEQALVQREVGGMYREQENSHLERPDHTPLQSSSSELAERLFPRL